MQLSADNIYIIELKGYASYNAKKYLTTEVSVPNR